MSTTEPTRRSFLDRFRRPPTPAEAPPTPQVAAAPPAPDLELADHLRAAAEGGIIDGLHPDSSIEWENATAVGLDVSTYAENVIENLAYDRRDLTRDPEQLITAARIAGEYRAQWNGRDEAVTAAAEDLYAAVHATAGTTPDHTLHDLYRTATYNPGRPGAVNAATELEAMWDAEQERVIAAETAAATTRGITRVDELLLGVPGTGPDAAAERVAAASAIITADYEAYNADIEDVAGEWSMPEHPFPVDTAIAIKEADGNPLDAAYSERHEHRIAQERGYYDGGLVENENWTPSYYPDATAQHLIDVEIAATRTELQARGFTLSPEQQARLDATDLTADTTHTVAAGEPERSAASVQADPTTGQGQTLQQRMETEYLAGYDARIRTGLAYATADPDVRASLGGAVLREKVATYQELDHLAETLDRELPGAERHFYQEAADQPLTAPAEDALERTAYLVGRWGGLDPVINSQITAIDNQLLGVTHAPAVSTAGDSRDAWFVYSVTDAHAAEQALPLIDRDTTERLARIAATPTSGPTPGSTATADASATTTATTTPRAASSARVPGKRFQPASSSPATAAPPDRGTDLTL